MAPPRMTTDELGEFFVRPEDGSLWRLIGRCELPTGTLERVYPDETSRLLDLILDADVVEKSLGPTPDTLDGARARDALARLRLVALESVEPRRVGGAIGAPIFDGFVPLVRAEA